MFIPTRGAVGGASRLRMVREDGSAIRNMLVEVFLARQQRTGFGGVQPINGVCMSGIGRALYRGRAEYYRSLALQQFHHAKCLLRGERWELVNWGTM